MISRQFYSNGKFLLTGEYLVLNGALSLALPLKLGQSMVVRPVAGQNFIRVNSFVLEAHWFEADFRTRDLKILNTNDQDKAEFLQKILLAAYRLNPGILHESPGFDIRTEIQFDIRWGWGSSSTLIANVARWFEVDPFELHFRVSGGSGYDVACALAQSPILYRLSGKNPRIEAVDFDPPFSKALYFVYLGKKKDSAKSISLFANRIKSSRQEVKRISEITKALIRVKDLDNFRRLIDEHEAMMSTVLDNPAIKQSMFKDFGGSVKSLGAWGGDFVLMTWNDGIENLKAYLRTKKLEAVIPFDEIVLNRMKV